MTLSRQSSSGPDADDEVLREDYWVEVAGQDSDWTGTDDRVHVEIARPASTDDPGVQLPVVVEPSPYYGGIGGQPVYEMEVDLWYPDGDADGKSESLTGGTLRMDEDELVEFTGTDEASIGPSDYESEFLEQGYVWAYAASVGTEESTGCLDTGGDREVNGLEAVVDWFNGRATAYTSKEGDETADADWTNGDTGMIGGSYNGTLPNAVASRGVDGLETIVPIVAISSWYQYYRMNGHVMAPGNFSSPSYGVDTDTLQRAVVDDPEACEHVRAELIDGQDRETANYNEFWAERDYTTGASAVEASVLVVHGLYDYNVKLRNASEWIRVLDDHDVPYKVWFHQGAHDDPRSIHPSEWFDLLEDWFAHWLKGEDNGVMDSPTARVQRGDVDGPLESYDDWPDPETESVPVEFTSGGPDIGGLALAGDADGVEESLVDEPEESITDLVDASESDHRLLYRTDPLEESVRLSGTPEMDLELAFDEPAAIVSVALVDFDANDDPEIVNMGWANPHNRASLEEALAIEPGESYRLEFPMQPVDHVFEAGHRIGVVVYSSDMHFTKRPPTDPELTLSVGESGVELPVVGGEEALAEALGEPFSDVAVTAAGETIPVEGEAKISLTVTDASEVVVDGLWIGWDVVDYETDHEDGEFTANGREAVFSYDSPASIAPQLTIQPSDTYRDGAYLLEAIATDEVGTATDTATVEIDGS